MCGIIGYVGAREAAPILLDGLARLEYRGYDSAGIALAGAAGISAAKAQGRLSVLRERTHEGRDFPGHTGIGHTRWATHGEPSDLNAHPHLSASGRVAIVHNGIVENYMALREFLAGHGYTFRSDTDTEVVAELMDYFYHGDPLAAAQEAAAMLEGSFALGILFSDYPWQILAVRKDSPLIIGLGEEEHFIASDIPAILPHTRRVLRLGEREFAVLTRDGVVVFDRRGERVHRASEEITWDVASAEKAGYEHFMLKEIMEQPKAIHDTLAPRLKEGRVVLELQHISDDMLRAVDRIHIVACGSAWHVGCIGRILLQDLLRIPVHCELASEFRYSRPLLDERSLAIVISQSGETIDTLFALREAKRLGAKILSIVNVVGSAIAQESDDVLYTWAGPEIAVATTKAYSTQLSMFYLLALYLGDLRGKLSPAAYEARVASLLELPGRIEALLGERALVQSLAARYFGLKDLFFIGRHLDYALALEGSLKLKEISYMHSEAYPAGELKHGTISLIEPGTLVVALCTETALHEKMLSNIREVKARGAAVIALVQEGTAHIAEAADHVLWLPADQEDFTLPSLSVVPLQLFAYYVASLKGCDIDKPRNLAKSVTVE